MANNERLDELKDSIDAKKEEISSSGYDVGSTPWAKQKRQLADLVDRYELRLESERVAAAVHEWEELHPPVVEDCPICLEPVEFDFEVCVCCLKYMCQKCSNEIVQTGDASLISTCPMCRVDHRQPNDFNKVVRESAEEGRPEGQYLHGKNLFEEEGKTRSEKEEGFRLMKSAAKQNYPPALLYVGASYFSGVEGILDQSYTEAFSFYEQAAKAGVPYAHNCLSRMYTWGDGVEKDESRGVYHCTIAYGLGSREESSHVLGVIYAEGRYGYNRSVVRAKHYFEVSCVEHDNIQSYFDFGSILVWLGNKQYEGEMFIPGYSHMPKALYWYRKATACPNAEATECITCESFMISKKLEQEVKSYCASCKKKTGALSQPLKACSLCKAAYYCGKECQRNHWKAGHKVDCIKRNYPPKQVETQRLFRFTGRGA